MKKIILEILAVIVADVFIALLWTYFKSFTLSQFQTSLMITGLVTCLITAIFGVTPNYTKSNTESYYFTSLKGIKGYNRPMANMVLVVGGAIAFIIGLLLGVIV